MMMLRSATTRVAFTRRCLGIKHLAQLPVVLGNESLACRNFSNRRRRPKQVATKYQRLEEQQQQQQPDRGGLQQAFVPAEDNMDDYLAKASLSPWVPVPDPVARKMLEIARAGPDDIHIELGSGDGRMNFHALDAPFSVKQSIGVDIDEQLVGLAEERLAKRHPQPKNLQFHVQDLMGDTDGIIWNQPSMKDATIITMYFVQDALKKLKSKLEMMTSDGCRVVSCGYAMPDWEPDYVEVILDLPIYLYTAPFYNKKGTARNEEISLTPAEQVAMLEEEERQRLSPSAAAMLQDQEKAFAHNGQDDDVEEIEVPYLDTSTMVDGHWDDFDEEEEGDLDGNPAISKWRKPE